MEQLRPLFARRKFTRSMLLSPVTEKTVRIPLYIDGLTR